MSPWTGAEGCNVGLRVRNPHARGAALARASALRKVLGAGHGAGSSLGYRTRLPRCPFPFQRRRSPGCSGGPRPPTGEQRHRKSGPHRRRGSALPQGGADDLGGSGDQLRVAWTYGRLGVVGGRLAALAGSSSARRENGSVIAPPSSRSRHRAASVRSRRSMAAVTSGVGLAGKPTLGAPVTSSITEDVGGESSPYPVAAAAGPANEATAASAWIKPVKSTSVAAASGGSPRTVWPGC